MITNAIDLLLISKLVNVRFDIVVLVTNVVPLNFFFVHNIFSFSVSGNDYVYTLTCTYLVSVVP